MNKVERSIEWYKSNIEIYKKISNTVENLLKEFIISSGVSYLDVTSREKKLDSFSNKAKSDKYLNPESEIKDVAGIRVITYVESDVIEICKIIENEFEIDKEHSVDKSTSLKVTEVGYRSVHYVAKFTESRLKFNEYKHYKDIYFEIQVRTILQHAWAEIEHDRNYKFVGVLPESNEIKRRFSLLAGMLEVSDREFDSLVKDIDKYAAKVVQGTKTGELDIPIDSVSLLQYLTTKYEKVTTQLIMNYGDEDENPRKIIDELYNFGIDTLKKLDDILSETLLTEISKVLKSSSIIGLMRTVMIATNYEKYFENSWNTSSFPLDNHTFVSITEYFNIPLDKIKEKYNKE